MTHFFLHGGATGIDSEKNKIFFQNICKDGDRILILPFAFNESVWQESFEALKKRFIQYNPEKSISFDCASGKIKTLIQQISNHDVLYFTGGREEGHLNILNQLPNKDEIFKDKYIVGISAGADIRATYYYTQDYEETRLGLGTFPIKIICHRGSDKYPARLDEERLIDLETYKENLPIYKITEQEYIEFTL